MSEAFESRGRAFVRVAATVIVAAQCGIQGCLPSKGVESPEVPASQESLIHEGKLPPGYRDWRVISVAHEEGTFDDIRAVLGNDVAINAYREGKPVFPDGSIIARLAWRDLPSEENNKVFGRAQSFVAGPPVHGVQFMVKDSKSYASMGGWEFAQFDEGKPLLDKATLQGCVDCHALIADRDRVFTRYAP